MLAPPLGSWRPLLGEILDPPLPLLSICSSVEKIVMQPTRGYWAESPSATGKEARLKLKAKKGKK